MTAAGDGMSGTLRTGGEEPVELHVRQVEVLLLRQPSGFLHAAGCRDNPERFIVGGPRRSTPQRWRLAASFPDPDDCCRCVEQAQAWLEELPPVTPGARQLFVFASVPSAPDLGSVPSWLSVALLATSTGVAPATGRGGGVGGVLPAAWLEVCQRWHTAPDDVGVWPPSALSPAGTDATAAKAVAQVWTALVADDPDVDLDRARDLLRTARHLTR